MGEPQQRVRERGHCDEPGAVAGTETGYGDPVEAAGRANRGRPNPTMDEMARKITAALDAA